MPFLRLNQRPCNILGGMGEISKIVKLCREAEWVIPTIVHFTRLVYCGYQMGHRDSP